MISLLFLLLLVPLAAGGLLLLFAGASQARSARWIALAGSIAVLAMSLSLGGQYRQLSLSFDRGRADAAAASPIRPQVEYRKPWLTLGGAAEQPVILEFHFGLDGVSVAMIVLTALLTVACVLISWESIRERESEFYAALLILETGLIGVFCAFDALLFYVFFEFTLIPLFFLIAIWGGPQRRYAAVKFFLYTLAGSLVTLLGLVTLVGSAAAGGLESPCSLPQLAAWYRDNPLSPSWQMVVFLALAAGFLIKVPVFPFHTWLPLAHVEAPTAGSVLLAGVLLKLGTYGFLRLCLPMLPAACLSVGVPMAAVLGVVGIVYGSLCALVQRDVKKLVAYSSVAHLGFCMLGLFALNSEGVTGGVLQMINHGLSTGALFLIVGMFYERYHTRLVDDLGGLANRLPLMAAGMVFVSMASVGLPGLNGFPGEMLSLAGMFKRHPLYAAAGASGLILGAWYLLTMLQYVFFGPLKEPVHGASAHSHPVRDISLRELGSLVPIAVAILWIGLTPQPLIDMIRPDVEAITQLYARGPDGGESVAQVSPDRTFATEPRP
ncbi:MAG: NADH-quinone oxidoreductase subunit M [Pirellulales bacterium]|nr:NADH-quinone oxidoreductase subunit M [Pirellulales bacterium]